MRGGVNKAVNLQGDFDICFRVLLAEKSGTFDNKKI